MRTEVITARSIDEAVERIFEELKENAAGRTTSGRQHVIYFDGWDGLGASAVLRAVRRHLTAPAASRRALAARGLEFSQVIHLDCSKWESRRAMQRALAEQLKLPTSVLEMFDAQDEEDDYHGVGKGDRAEIPQVAAEIYQHIQKLSSRFLVIFHNGSCEEVDLDTLGFPLAGYSRNKALWSFQGRFRLYPRMKIHSALNTTKTTTDVVLSATSPNADYLPMFLRHEAEEVVRKIHLGGDLDWAALATNCFLHMVKLCRMGNNHLIDYGLAIHVCNYWICDGIIRLQQQPQQKGDVDTDALWTSSHALWREMRLDSDYYQNPLFLQSPDELVVRCLPEIPYWTSPTYGFMLIADEYKGHIPNKFMFQLFDKLCVLKLSDCKFSFTSPPFIFCHGLRFLWINHCRDEWGSGRDRAGMGEDVHLFFKRLWVLDVRSSGSRDFLPTWKMDFMTQLRELNVVDDGYWDMGQLQGRLHNIRRLRVTKTHTECRHTDPRNLFSEKDKLELLDFSGNDAASMRRLSVASSCSNLETVIIDGSKALEEISLKGCAKLKNLLLSGLFPDLKSLDITGTPVETLDLSAVAAPKLDKLFMLDCGKLCAILWPPPAEDRRRRYLGELRMDTTTVTAPAAKGRSPTEFDWYISVRDARVLGSLEPVKDYFGTNSAHMEISTATLPSPSRLHADAGGGNRGDRIKSSSGQQAQGNLQQLKDQKKICYADVAATVLKDTGMQQQADEGDDDVCGIMCVCPAPPQLQLLRQGCYIPIEDQTTRAKLQTTSITVPGFICDGTKILHVHNSMSITSIVATLLGSSWNELEWCRVERCPELQCLFIPKSGEGPEGSSGMVTFKKLRTIWASHLRNARYVVEHPRKGPIMCRAFANLVLLHIYCCPRLVYAIPFPSTMTSWDSLETLEIMWCGDLSRVIQDYTITSQTIFIGFPRLKHVHLHELPMLQGIINSLKFPILAPFLESVKIRGCWSLVSLPQVDANKLVECNCEKEWWDRLKWFSERAASHYKPIHPRYYKKTMLRGSPLR